MNYWSLWGWCKENKIASMIVRYGYGTYMMPLWISLVVRGMSRGEEKEKEARATRTRFHSQQQQQLDEAITYIRMVMSKIGEWEY